MDLEQVKQFFEQEKDNETVKNYLQGLSQVTPDGVKTFLETEEGKKILQPKMDSYFTKGLDTWKANNLKKLVDEEVKKVNPPADPLAQELQELKRTILMKELKEKAVSALDERKLPLNFTDFVIGEDEETTLSRIDSLNSVFESHLNQRVQERLKSGGITPPGSGSPPNTSMSLSQLKNMSAEQIAKLDNKTLEEALKNNQ